MDKNVFKIYDDRFLGVNVSIENKPIQELLSYEDRLSALVNANEKLDIDLAEIWLTFRDDPSGIFAWAITDQRYMHDSFRSGRKNTILWYYYLIELIKLFDKNKAGVFVDVESAYFSPGLIDVFRSNSIFLRRQFRYTLFGYLIRLGYCFKYFKQILFFLMGFFGKKYKFNNTCHSILIDVPDKIEDHRYGAYIKKLKEDYFIFYFNFKNGVLFSDKKKYRIVSFLGVADIINAVKSLLSFRSSIRINKEKIRFDNLFFSIIIRYNVFFIIRNFLTIAALRFFFNNQKIDCVLVESCLNDNLRKILPLCSRERSVPCIYFIPRPLTPYRPAERIVKYDLFDFDKQILPDFYHVKDHNSYQVLVSQGVNPNNIIESDRERDHSFVADKYVSVKEKYYCAITVLLGGVFSINERLINLFINNSVFDRGRVLFSVRTHPALPLSIAQENKLSKYFPHWFDASKTSYIHIPSQYKFVVSSSSTATVEAARSGCGVIWCPFVEEQSLLMYPIMSKFGVIVKNKNELDVFIRSSLNNEQDLKNFIDKCQSDANVAFSARCSVDDGYIQLKKLVFDYNNKLK